MYFFLQFTIPNFRLFVTVSQFKIPVILNSCASENRSYHTTCSCLFNCPPGDTVEFYRFSRIDLNGGEKFSVECSG